MSDGDVRWHWINRAMPATPLYLLPLWLALFLLHTSFARDLLVRQKGRYSLSDVVLVLKLPYNCWWPSEARIFPVAFLAPSGALIAIPTCYWSSTPTFSDHTRPQYWTFTFWATTALSKAITGLIFWLHVYLISTIGHHCKIVQDSAR